MSFYNNADWYQTFTVTSGGSPVDLTGKSLLLTLRANVNDAQPLLTADVDGGLLSITDGPAGKFALAVPFATTRTIPAGNHYWDLVDVLSANSRTRIAGGRFLVRQGVTV